MKKPKTAALTIEVARQKLTCDVESGVIRWARSPGLGLQIKAGAEAGWVTDEGYRMLQIGGVNHLAHRIVWLFAHGELPNGILDHINGNRLDNRLANLRPATNAENTQNRWKPGSKSFSGLIGAQVFGNKWRSAIKVNGKRHHLGLYDTPHEAHAAYVEAKRSMCPKARPWGVKLVGIGASTGGSNG